MKYVCIGNSTAAIAAIEGIRSIDQEGEIVVISNETQHCYGRPTISYCLMGATKKEDMLYRPKDFYEKNKVTTMLGEVVTAIDAKAKTVSLQSGKVVAYDQLLVATGSRPFVPPMQGLEQVEKKFSFMTFDDMEALEKELGKDKNVLVIGAGLIGLKCVEGILERVGSVTVVDLADRVLPSILDAEGAKMIQNQLEEKGVSFILNDCASSFPTANSVVLKSGKELSFDVLVVAVGVRPNIELVKEAGGEVNRGILVDTKQATSLANVYAAGDCTEGYDSSIDTKRILALLPNAYFQGKCAGINMAGGDSQFDQAIPMNAIGFFGSHILSAGVYEGECHAEITATTYKKLFIKDNHLVGFILINDFLRAGIYTSLVRGKVDLKDVDLELLKNKPQLLAFSKEMRANKLTKKV